MKNTVRKLLVMIFAIAMVFSFSFAQADRADAATTLKISSTQKTICVGKTATLKVSGLSSGYTVKWSSASKSKVTVSKSSVTSTSSSYKVKGVAKTSGTTVSAKVYNKKGTLVKTLKCKVIVKGHTYKVTKAATCSTKGSKKCSRCGKVLSIPATGEHTYMWVKTDMFTEQDPDEEGDYYITRYGYSYTDTRVSQTKYSCSRSDGKSTTFEAYFSKAPDKVAGNGELAFDIGTRVLENNNDQYYFAQNCMIYMYNGPGSQYGGQTKFYATEDGLPNDTAIGSNSQERTSRIGTTMPVGYEGAMKAVKLCSDGVATWIIYEWKPVCH